jgi:hypothetical protein
VQETNLFGPPPKNTAATGSVDATFDLRVHEFEVLSIKTDLTIPKHVQVKYTRRKHIEHPPTASELRSPSLKFFADYEFLLGKGTRTIP